MIGHWDRWAENPARKRSCASRINCLLRQSHRGLTRLPLAPAVLVLIVGLQDPDKISHAGSIPVFGKSRKLGIGCGLAPLPKPHQEIGDVSHGVLSAVSRGSPPGRERPAGVTPPTLLRNCRLAGPVPLLFTPDLLLASGNRLAPLRTGMKGTYLGRLGLVNRNQSTGIDVR